MKHGLVRNLVQKAGWISLLMAFAGFAQTEDYSQWTYHKPVRINTTGLAGGAGVTAPVYNFPVLVRLTANERDVTYYSLGRGADLRVSKADGVTPLPYQIERWDSAAGKVEVWVLMDTVKASDSTQNIRLHWNKAGVTSRSSGAAVFTTSNGFAGVWHLAPDSGVSLDATANLNHAKHVGQTTATEGAVGLARTYNGEFGEGDMDTAKANATFNMSANDRVTLSAWVRRAAPNGDNATEGIAALFDWTRNGSNVNNRSYGLLHSANNGLAFHVSQNGGDGANEFIANSSIAADDGVWFYVSGVADGASVLVYVNGQEAASVPFSGNIHYPTIPDIEPFKIGLFDDNLAANSQFFNGTIDEVRLSKVARSPDWERLSYENQKPGSVVARLGLTTPTPPPIAVAAASRAPSRAFGVVRRGTGLVFDLPSTGEAGTLSLIDAKGKVIWSASVSPGAKSFVWNGMGARGFMAAGVYTARFVSAGQVHARTILHTP